MRTVIIGAGGHGKVVLEILRLAGRHNVVGFIDADPFRVGEHVSGVPVLGGVNLLPKLRRQDIEAAIIAIGDNRARVGYMEYVAGAGLELTNAVHPSAVVSPSAKLGRGVVVAAAAVIGVDAQVDDLAIINTSAVVDHECHVGLAAHICPGALLAGLVRVGGGALVGMGARILPCLTVGEHAIIGAGAVVVEDVPPDVTVMGVPAKQKA